MHFGNKNPQKLGWTGIKTPVLDENAPLCYNQATLCTAIQYKLNRPGSTPEPGHNVTVDVAHGTVSSISIRGCFLHLWDADAIELSVKIFGGNCYDELSFAPVCA